MKRKADALEDSPASPDWSSFDYPSSTSTASPESVKASTDYDYPRPTWNIGAPSYLNSRTRKRYRDGRPTEETIHQNTLSKLFAGQRQLQIEEQRDNWHTSTQSTSGLNHTTSTFNLGGTIADWQTPQIVLTKPERNQRSLDSFFGASSSRRPPQPTRPQPSAFQFSSMSTHEHALPRCEDCSTTLEPSFTTSFMTDDAMNMDVDMQHDEWACASCSRRVCDLCAVRGDHRICLECAVPGGG